MDGRVLCSGFTYLKPRHSRHDDKCGLNVNVSNLDTKNGRKPKPTILTTSTRSIPNVTVVRTSLAVLPRLVLLNHALRIPNPNPIPCQLHAEATQHHSSNHNPSPPHFLAAPKFVLTFFSLESSLSSPAAAAAAAFPAAPGAFFFFDAPDAFPVADVGVGAPDPTSLFPPPRNDVDIGVGASEPPGVEFEEAGVWASCVVSNANQESAPTNKARKPNQAIGRGTNVVGIIRHGAPREDAVRLGQPRLAAGGGRVAGALCVVVEADDDVAGGRGLEVFGFFLVDRVFFGGLCASSVSNCEFRVWRGVNGGAYEALLEGAFLRDQLL